MNNYPRDLLIAEDVIREFEEYVGVRFIDKTECSKALAEHDAKVRADYAKEIDMDRISYHMGRTDGILQGKADKYQEIRADAINAIKNDLHKRLSEEMNKPYQDQGLCQGLYFGIQRCDWYLDDGKEQKNE